MESKVNEVNATHLPVGERIAIVSDEDGNWYVRKIRIVEHDLDLDEKVYHCDLPIGGKYAALTDVPLIVGAIARLSRYPKLIRA